MCWQSVSAVLPCPLPWSFCLTFAFFGQPLLDLLDRDYEVKTLFKLYKANADGDNLIIEKEKDQFVTFPLLRQQTPKRDGSPFLCLSDFIRPLSSGIPDTIGAFASSIDADMEGLYEQDPYKHLLVQTLSDRLAEAATEKMHEYVRKEAWGYAKNENLGMADLLVEKYQGIRPAVGYPSLPDQSVNFLLDDLLDMKQIGISLTENGAMYPHASVCGLMFAHPNISLLARLVKTNSKIMPVAGERT